MRTLWMMAVILVMSQGARCLQAPQEMPAGQLVREVVYNELQDHTQHGFWRYWIERKVQNEKRLEDQVETTDGPVTRLIESNGHPLTPAGQGREQARLNHLLRSPQEQVALHQKYDDDEKRTGSILALLPDAFRFEHIGEENGCYRLRFHPNPNYTAHSVEARIFHAMSGELWIDARLKRLVRLDGHLDDNVDFGFGILGRLHKGGWFRLQRTRVSPDGWKTQRLEIHMNGRALLFKTIALETSEVRGGFVPVPAKTNLAQAIDLFGSAPQTPSLTVAAASAADPH